MPEGVSNFAVASGQMAMPSGSAMGAGAPSRMLRHAAPKASRASDELSAPAEPAPPAPAARPEPAAKETERARQATDAKGDAGKKSKDQDKAGTCSATVKVDKTDGASDTQALLTLVEGLVRAHACATPGEVKLRVSIDRSGKVTKVVILSGRREIGQKLLRKLTGATSATRAAGPGSEATVEITVTIA
jgi:hypothetical protein